MRIMNHEQRSPEWFAARCGVMSASNFDKLITSTGKPSTQIDGYINQMIADKIIGYVPSNGAEQPNAAMQRGTDMEPEARAYYELIATPVVEVGFCLHDEYEFGCSPDGLVGDDGLLEIKCPSAHTQIEYIKSNSIPSKYVAQVQGQMLVTGRKWCDFLSYHPDLKPLLVRVQRDADFIRALQAILLSAIDKIQDGVRECKP
jgi:putative phage-type endonuclease